MLLTGAHELGALPAHAFAHGAGYCATRAHAGAVWETRFVNSSMF